LREWRTDAEYNVEDHLQDFTIDPSEAIETAEEFMEMIAKDEARVKGADARNVRRTGWDKSIYVRGNGMWHCPIPLGATSVGLEKDGQALHVTFYTSKTQHAVVRATIGRHP